MGLFDFFKKKREPSIPPEALTLWVHRKSHFDQIAQLMADRDETQFPFWDMGGVFGAAPALMTDKGPMPLMAQHLEALELDGEEAFQRACQNVLRGFPSFEAKDGVFSWRGRFADAVVVQGTSVKASLPVKGTVVALFPAEGVVLAASADDEAALSRLLDLAEAEFSKSEEYRSLRAVAWDDGAKLPRQWFPPDGHPLEFRFTHAALRSCLQEVKGDHQVFAADAAPLAHLEIVEKDGEASASASWARDSDVIVPWFTDTLVLLDTPDQPLARLEVPFVVFQEVFPEAVEGLSRDDEEEPEDAQLWRLRGALFPTARQRKFLLQRAAFVGQSPDVEPREVPGADLLADFDGGAPLLVAAGSGDQMGQVELKSPDARFAFVTPAEFGTRAEKLPTVDRFRYFQSFFVQKMLSLMLGREPGADDASAPVAPEGLAEQASTALPALLSSNDLRRMKSELAEKSEDLASQLVFAKLETWEPAHLFPVIRPPEYSQGAAENEKGMIRGIAGPEVEVINSMQPLTRPAPEGLRLDLVSDRGNSMLIVDGMTMSDAMKESAWRTALLNLDAASLKPMKQEAEGRWVGEWHDDYDFSRLLLLPRLVRACQVKGVPLVFAPTVGRTWVTGSEDLAGQAAVLDAIDAHFASGAATTPYQFRQLLFGWPWTVSGESLVRWAMPAGHALAARFEALDASLARRRAESRKHVGQYAEQATRPSPEGRKPQA